MTANHARSGIRHLPFSYYIFQTSLEKFPQHILKFFLQTNLFDRVFLHKNVYACLISIHNTVSLSRHEQVCLSRLRFERYFSHHRANDGRSISPMMGEVSLR